MSLLFALMSSLIGVFIPMQDSIATMQHCDGIVRPSGEYEITLEFDKEVRHALLYIPSSVADGAEVPLVMSLHGFTSNMYQQREYSQWNVVADDNDFIVVYPQGIGFPRRWNVSPPPFSTDPTDDVGFLRELVAYIDSEYCIDLTRVYVNGFSNGGGMSHRLACEAADVFTAIGIVAGAHGEFGACGPSRSVPVIAFHGTADNVVPYGGGRSGGFDLPDIQDWTRDWASRNSCSLTASHIDVPDGVDYVGIRYTGCSDDAEVILYTIEQRGHTWPGGGVQPERFVGKVSRDINASELMWIFFNQHLREIQN